MTGEEFKSAAIRLFGDKGWQSKVADSLGVDRSQVWRYTKSDSVPGPVNAAMECWLEREDLK